MAATILCGWEMGTAHEAAAVVLIGTGTAAVQSTTKHSGTYALRCQSPSASSATADFQSRAAGGALRTIAKSVRCYLYVATLPSGSIGIIGFFAAANAAMGSLRLTSAGQLQVAPVGGTVVTSTNALTTGVWYCIEVEVGWSAGVGARVYVDGVDWASSSDGSALSAIVVVKIGPAAGTATVPDLYFDDIVMDDAVLGGVLWYPYNLALLAVTADSNRGNWTGGAGGTTNLFGAIDNQPPVGLTAGSDTDASQIQNATSATYPATAAQLGQFTCQSYTTVGINGADTIRAVQAFCSHGEGIVTGTKPGGVFIVSNPAQGTLGDWFDYGDDVGALGTWPFTTAGTPTRGWFTAWATPVASPAVTYGTQPVVGVFKNVASTREGHVAFAGIYVAYTVNLPVELLGRPDGLHGQQQLHQLLAQ